MLNLLRSPLTSFLRYITKEGDKTNFGVFFPQATTPKSPSQPKLIDECLARHLQRRLTNKKFAAKCRVEKCRSKAVLVHKDKDGDHQVIRDDHGKGIDGRYPATGVL